MKGSSSDEKKKAEFKKIKWGFSNKSKKKHNKSHENK